MIPSTHRRNCVRCARPAICTMTGAPSILRNRPAAFPGDAATRPSRWSVSLLLRAVGALPSYRMRPALTITGALATWQVAPLTCWRLSDRHCTACVWNAWSGGKQASMDEQQWTHYLLLLVCTESAIPSACVGCWYEQHPAGDEAFPGDRVSST